MNCTESRSAMLACELSNLSPTAANPLARHLERCGECRARADAIVAHTATLRTALAARSRPQAMRPFRRARALGALTLAAGLILVVTLARRTPHLPMAPSLHSAQHGSAVSIENAQGRAVTIVEGPNTIDVIFHAPEPNE